MPTPEFNPEAEALAIRQEDEAARQRGRVMAWMNPRDDRSVQDAQNYLDRVDVNGEKVPAQPAELGKTGPTAKLDEHDIYTDMSISKLAKLSAEAEFHSDRTTMSSVDDALLDKLSAMFEKHGYADDYIDNDPTLSEEQNLRQKSEQDRMYDHVIQMRDKHLAKLSAEKQAKEQEDTQVPTDGTEPTPEPAATPIDTDAGDEIEVIKPDAVLPPADSTVEPAEPTATTAEPIDAASWPAPTGPAVDGVDGSAVLDEGGEDEPDSPGFDWGGEKRDDTDDGMVFNLPPEDAPRPGDEEPVVFGIDNTGEIRVTTPDLLPKDEVEYKKFLLRATSEELNEKVAEIKRRIDLLQGKPEGSLDDLEQSELELLERLMPNLDTIAKAREDEEDVAAMLRSVFGDIRSYDEDTFKDKAGTLNGAVLAEVSDLLESSAEHLRSRAVIAEEVNPEFAEKLELSAVKYLDLRKVVSAKLSELDPADTITEQERQLDENTSSLAGLADRIRTSFMDDKDRKWKIGPLKRLFNGERREDLDSLMSEYGARLGMLNHPVGAFGTNQLSEDFMNAVSEAARQEDFNFQAVLEQFEREHGIGEGNGHDDADADPSSINGTTDSRPDRSSDDDNEEHDNDDHGGHQGRPESHKRRRRAVGGTTAAALALFALGYSHNLPGQSDGDEVDPALLRAQQAIEVDIDADSNP